jgi:hypothetical protein
MDIKPWIEAVRLHPDVESETTSRATYAIDLGALVEKDSNVPPTYRDAYSFFRATHLTSGIKRLIEEVCERLSGKDGDRVLQLRSPFGGGKSHTLASLFYAVKNRKDVEKALPQIKSFPKVSDVRVAVFDGEKFDAVTGKTIDGQKIRTMWGFIGWQLGTYELIKEQDIKRIAPGGDTLKKMLSEKPTLILLDEVSRYLEKAMGEKVGESSLFRQAADFIQTLTTEVANSKYSCLLFSLQASARESFGNVEVLSMLDHLTSRVDAKREPVVGDEIFYVLRKRLFDEPPLDEIANKIADLYIDSIKKNILSYIPSDVERREIEERIIKYKDRFVIAYPFHPALIDLMRERWASISDFQRTRDVITLLAVILRILKKRGATDFLISPTDIPLDSADVRSTFFTAVGQREPYQAVLEADFIGINATVKRIDELFKEIRKPATKVATAIFMYSFGGQLKMDGREGETLPPGVTEQDLMQAVISKALDSTTTKAVLKELISKCLYIHFDGARYAFKTTPNVNKLLEDEAADGRLDNEIKETIKKILEKELGGKSAIIWPQQSKNIPDKEARFLIAYLPFEFVYKKDQDKLALEYLTQCGDKPRIYKNSLGIAIPEKNSIEPLKRAIGYLISIDRLKGKKKALNITEQQMELLKEREKTETAARDSSLRDLYSSVWLLKIDNGKSTLDKIEIGGRALQAQNIHERLTELLTRVSPPKVFETLKAGKIVDLLKDREGLELETISEAFFTSPSFPRITDESVLKKAVAEGVNKGLFGITIKSKVQTIEGKLTVPKEQVTMGKPISEDEVDLSSGFLVTDKIIPKEEKEPEPVQPAEKEPEEIKVTEEGKISRISFLLRVNRLQLFKSFNALGNLAEKAGEIFLKVDASSKEGIDPAWLRNAVEEPIEEAGVEIKKE